MTRSAIRMCCSVLVTAIVIAGRSYDGDPPAASSAGSTASRVLGVEELMKATTQPPGVLRVAGVVSAVSPAEKRLALIDLRELDECGKTTCAQFTLPVEWAGAMPAVRDVVRVEGEVKETNGKLIFVAHTLERTTASAARGSR